MAARRTDPRHTKGDGPGVLSSPGEVSLHRHRLEEEAEESLEEVSVEVEVGDKAGRGGRGGGGGDSGAGEYKRGW